MRPVIGAVMWQYVDVQLRAVDVRLIGLQRCLALRDGRALRLQDLLGDGVLRDQRFVSLQVDPRVLQRRLILGSCPSACSSCT